VRIVYLNPVGALGGAERCLLDLLAAVRGALPAAELYLVAFGDGPLLRRAEALGVRVQLLRLPEVLARLGDSGLQGRGRAGAALALARQGVPAGLATSRYVSRLRRTLRQLRPTVVHSNGIKSHLLTRLAAGKGVPVVWHIHDFWSFRPVIGPALRWAARRAAGAIAVSHAVDRDARGVLGGLPIAVVHNAIDLDHFAPAPGDGRRLDDLARLPAPEPGCVRVGLVATYARWKGQDLFLEAAARVMATGGGRGVRFYLIGGPIYGTAGSQFAEGELRARAAALRIADRVGFIGFQQDVADVYRGLDIVVHASTQPEPFGLTIIEAMACGKPVIAAQAGGAAELFSDNQDAVGVHPGDAAALAAAIRVLAADPVRRQRLSAAARQTAVARFSRQRLGREVAAVYNRYL
jgi:glycosyltransferase involved in cell wall biosynthesis